MINTPKFKVGDIIAPKNNDRYTEDYHEMVVGVDQYNYRVYSFLQNRYYVLSILYTDVDKVLMA
jgi:hypothetical protein